MQILTSLVPMMRLMRRLRRSRLTASQRTPPRRPPRPPRAMSLLPSQASSSTSRYGPVPFNSSTSTSRCRDSAMGRWDRHGQAWGVCAQRRGWRSVVGSLQACCCRLRHQEAADQVSPVWTHGHALSLTWLHSCVVEDDKVGTDFLEEAITAFEDYVQSIDVAAFNKI